MTKNLLILFFSALMFSQSLCNDTDYPSTETDPTDDWTLGDVGTIDSTFGPTEPNTTPQSKSGWGWIWIPLALLSVILGIVLIFVILCCRTKKEDEDTDSKQSSTSSLDKDDKFPLDSQTEHRNSYDYKFDLKPEVAQSVKDIESGDQTADVSTIPSSAVRSELESKPSQTTAEKKKSGSGEKIAGIATTASNSAQKTPSNPAVKTASNPAVKTASNSAVKTASNSAVKTASNPAAKPSNP